MRLKECPKVLLESGKLTLTLIRHTSRIIGTYTPSVSMCPTMLTPEQLPQRIAPHPVLPLAGMAEVALGGSCDVPHHRGLQPVGVHGVPVLPAVSVAVPHWLAMSRTISPGSAARRGRVLGVRGAVRVQGHPRGAAVPHRS
ncbi:hypothetical protein [Pseudomonas aeruginosa]|uniref:hypothetical protein n=1 Tax=Pseudomonas aeruginosa TaxID=287 RepID=UPI0010588DA2|nr:hypothetical protein [Pseudomonas aeruginosa]